MMLGALSLAWDPDKWTAPEEQKFFGDVQTWASHFLFDFGSKIVGREIELEWEWMSQAQFDALDVLYQANAPVVWDPQESGVPTFTVEVAQIEGKLFDVALWDQPYRKDVKVTLVIVAASELVLS